MNSCLTQAPGCRNLRDTKLRSPLQLKALACIKHALECSLEPGMLPSCLQLGVTAPDKPSAPDLISHADLHAQCYMPRCAQDPHWALLCKSAGHTFRVTPGPARAG